MSIPREKYFIKTRKPGVYTPSEASIQATCTELLVLDDWRHLRTDPVSDRATVGAIRAALAKAGLLIPAVAKLLNARGKGFGEPGMADDLFIRYTNMTGHQDAEVLWVEFKSLHGKPKPEQLQWATTERARGAMVWVATVDFEPTIEGFREKYAKSGLARKIR